MRVLLVGDGNSFLILSLARRLKENNESIIVDILCDRVLAVKDSPYDKVYQITRSGPLSKIPYLNAIGIGSELKKQLKTIPSNHYDATHILFVANYYGIARKELKRVAKKSVVTVFGSDFYKSGIIIRTLIKKVLRKADVVTSSNSKTLADVVQHFDIANKDTRVCYFGLSVLDEIDKISEKDVLGFRERHSIPEKAKIIACGYNASVNQNLDQILNEIEKLKGELKDCCLAFQFHGVRNDVAEGAIAKAKEMNIPFVVFDERWSDFDLAVYRCAVDVFIQLQTTDVFSGAMQEHIYSGSRVITGDWLPYEILDERNTDYARISKIADLRGVIIPELSRGVDVAKNKDVIGSISKWNKTIAKWQDLYN